MSYGPFGQQPPGYSAGPFAGPAQHGFPQQSFGQSGFGQSGFGQSGFGQPGFGQPGFGHVGFGGPTHGQQTPGFPGYGGAGYGIPGMPQPAPKKPRWPWLLAVVAILAVGAVITIVMAVRSSGEQPQPVPPPPGPGQVTPTPTPTPTATPTRTPSGPRTPAAEGTPPVTTVDPAGVPNELWDNDLYAEPIVAASRCGEDGPFADDPESRRKVADLVGCAERANEAATAGLSGQAETPVIFYRERTTSPCGQVDESGVIAFYCSANQTIYIDMSVFEQMTQPVQVQRAKLTIFHEYGHHVQARARILYVQSQLNESDDKRSRRIELQANCLSGIGMRASDQQGSPRVLEEFVRVYGDPRQGSETHGSGPNRMKWWLRGLNATDYGACNTFNVSDEDLAGS